MDGRSDEQLLAAVADGDRGALRELHERHTPWLTPRLLRRCNDRGLVDEVVQDTFVAIWRHPDRYRGTGEVAAWLWGIAIRRLVDGLRQQATRDRLTSRVGSAAANAAGVAPSPEEHLLLGVEYGDLGGAIDRLSPELRAVVQATILDGLSSREAGRLLGIPAGTVKTRMQRARAQLQEALS